MKKKKKIFSSTRIPEEGCDLIEKYPDSKHILIIIENQLFTMDVLSETGNPLQPEIIYMQLKRISELINQKNFERQPPIPTLTGR